MVVKASVEVLVALVEDMETCPDWVAMCKESRVEKRVSEKKVLPIFTMTFHSQSPIVMYTRMLCGHATLTQSASP